MLTELLVRCQNELGRMGEDEEIGWAVLHVGDVPVFEVHLLGEERAFIDFIQCAGQQGHSTIEWPCCPAHWIKSMKARSSPRRCTSKAGTSPT